MRARAQREGRKPRYEGRCRNGAAPRDDVAPVVRFKNPLEGEVVLEDLVKGRITFANEELDDLIIARSDGTPTYNFTVVVDDADMRITHVIRGDDHVNNTPRQINMLRALGAAVPAYAHLPMINGPDGAKLSKRHGAVSVLEYKEMGILPDALLNYLLRLGWSHGDQEIFSRDEMIELFDLDGVNRSAANFDFAKLAWVNQQHIMRAPPASLAPLLSAELERRGVAVAHGPPAVRTVEALRERSTTVVDMADRAMCYYSDFHEYEPAAAKAHLTPAAAPALAALRSAFAALGEWTEDATQSAAEQVAAQLQIKLGKVAQPLRVAITGSSASPGIGVTLALVGRCRTLERIDRALTYIESRA
jgi:glutamyl-tRNA synthetase